MARVANITFRADISQLTKQLKEMPNVTGAEARRMVAELKKEMANATKAAKAANAEVAKGAAAAGKAGKAGAAGMDELGKSSGQAQEATAKLGAAVSVVNPELGRMVTQAGAMTGAMQGLSKAGGLVGSALPIVGAVVVALGLSVAAYAKQSKIAHQETRELGGAVDGLSLSLEDLEKMQAAGTSALGTFRESVRKAALEVAVLSGSLTDLERKEQEAARAAALAIKPGMNAAAQAITDAQKEIDVLTAKLDRYQRTASDPDIYISDPTEELAAASKRLESAEGHLAALKEERIQGQEVIQTALELADAQKRGQQAGRDRAKAEAGDSKEQEKNLRRVEAARQSIDAARAKAVADTLGDEEKILQARDAELLKLRESAVLTGARAEATEAMAAVEQRAERDLAKLRAANLAEYDADREASHDAELARVREQAQALTSGASQFFGGMASLAEWAAEKQGEATAEAAERWFGFYKAMSITQVIIDGATAAVKAVAQLGPIAGGIAAGGIAALTGAQIGVIASQELPSFHQGGLAPDEGLARVLPGEGYVTQRGVAALGGPAGVAAVNRGEGAGGGPITVVHKYKHRVFGRFVQDAARLPGSPYRAHIKGDRRVGHRAA